MHLNWIFIEFFLIYQLIQRQRRFWKEESSSMLSCSLLLPVLKKTPEPSSMLFLLRNSPVVESSFKFAVRKCFFVKPKSAKPSRKILLAASCIEIPSYGNRCISLWTRRVSKSWSLDRRSLCSSTTKLACGRIRC